MAEIEYKLQKKNPILVAEAISKVVNLIRCNDKEKCGRYSEIPEYKLLKQKCYDVDQLISSTACQGMIALVEQGIVPLPAAFTEMITLLPFAKNYSGIISVIGTLLSMDLQVHIAEKKQYQTPFTIKPPQHPVITILKQEKRVWHDILNQMKYLLHHQDNIISTNSVELLRPALVYILCVPSHLPADCRKETWDMLLTSEQPCLSFLLEAYTWFQCGNTNEIEVTASIFLKFCDYAVKKNDAALSSALSPTLASLAREIISAGLDCQSYYSTLNQLLQISSQEAGSCVLMLLAETIRVCPVGFLKDILKCCMYILQLKCCNSVSVTMLKSVLLPWLMFGSSLTHDASQLMNEILKVINETEIWGSHTSKLFSNKLFNILRPIDSRVTIASHLCILTELWQSKPDSIEKWLEKVVSAPKIFLEKLQIFLSGLLLYNEDAKIQLRVLKLLLEMVKYSPEFSRSLIAVIFYKVIEEKEPKMKLELLRGFTEMAVLKENVTPVMHVLEMMKGIESLRPVTIHLYIKLWEFENRCYPFLEKMLKETPKNPENSWEHYIVNAIAMYIICKTRPRVDSKFLVSLQANILSSCVGPSGSVASCLALDGITSLCKAGIVDIVTTWKALAPRLNRDKRPAVIKSWCKFMAAVPELHCPNVAYEKTVSEVIVKLWSYVLQSDDIQIINAAFNALSKFNLDQFKLKDLPEKFRHGLKLPSAYAKTPVDAARKPEDVLPYIPSECWVQMLSNVKPIALNMAGSLLINWLHVEVSGFHFTVGGAEPANYSHLPPHCICRGLLHFLKVTLDPGDMSVVRECLRILSQPYSKSLPLVNWRFIQPFFTIPELQEYSIALCAKQLGTSLSVRKLLEDFIQQLLSSPKNEKEILNVFASLGDLSKGIPPSFLRPFVEQSLHWAIEQAVGSSSDNKEHAEKIVIELFASIKAALKKEDIHDANRLMLSLCIEALMERFEVDSPLFNAYVGCVVELKTKFVERMSSPSVWWEVKPEKLRVALGIRTALAQRTDTETPIVWLNECIDATLNMPSEHTTLLKSISSVIILSRDHESYCSWILELMGEIQVTIMDNKDNSQQTLVFLCDIFVITIIIVSGYDSISLSVENITSSRELRLQIFPQALAQVLSLEKWNAITSQVHKWLLCMQKSNLILPIYRAVFRQAFISLNYDKCVKESGFWLQYLDTYVAV